MGILHVYNKSTATIRYNVAVKAENTNLKNFQK